MSYYKLVPPSPRDTAQKIIEQLRIEFDLEYSICQKCALAVLSTANSSLSVDQENLTTLIDALNQVLMISGVTYVPIIK